MLVLFLCVSGAMAQYGSYPYPAAQNKYQDEPASGSRTSPVHSHLLNSDGPTTAAPFSKPLVLPEGSRIKIQDNRLQYTHGFNDDQTGTSVSEQGKLLSTNDGWEYVIVKKGSYSYTSPEGIPIKVDYIADHNGFRVLGETHG